MTFPVFHHILKVKLFIEFVPTTGPGTIVLLVLKLLSEPKKIFITIQKKNIVQYKYNIKQVS